MDLENAKYICETLGLTDSKIALRVDRELKTDTGEIVLHDVRYFLCSLDPNNVVATDLLRYVRQHWRIENCLHFLKDRWWDEDRHHTRRPGLSALMAAINNAAISIHRIFEKENLPIRAAADYIAWKPAIGLELLNS